MKYIGIDYGTKKTGFAVSDDDGVMAFPRDVIPTDKIFDYINGIIREYSDENITGMVIGMPESGTSSINDHKKRTERFIQEVKKQYGEMEIIMANEFASTQAVRATEAYMTGYDARRAMKAPRHGHKVAARDAGAAAIILQRYLDSRQSD